MGVSIKVEGVDKVLKRFKKLDKQILERADIGVNRAAIHLQDSIRHAIRGGTGKPRAVGKGKFLESVSIKKIAPLSNIVFSNHQAAIFLEKGTSPHFVSPKVKEVLYWKQDGKDMFSKGHIVGGISARHYFGDTAKQQTSNIIKIIRDEVKKVK